MRGAKGSVVLPAPRLLRVSIPRILTFDRQGYRFVKNMLQTTSKLAEAVLSLPPRSRAKLAEKLLQSLDDPEQKEIDRLWGEEAERRIDTYNQGYLKAIPGSEVFQKLKLHKK